MIYIGIGLIIVGVLLFLFIMAINKGGFWAKVGFIIFIIGIFVCLIGVFIGAIN